MLIQLKPFARTAHSIFSSAVRLSDLYRFAAQSYRFSELLIYNALAMKSGVYRYSKEYRFNSKASIKEVINTKTIQPELQDQ